MCVFFVIANAFVFGISCFMMARALLYTPTEELVTPADEVWYCDCIYKGKTGLQQYTNAKINHTRWHKVRGCGWQDKIHLTKVIMYTGTFLFISPRRLRHKEHKDRYWLYIQKPIKMIKCVRSKAGDDLHLFWIFVHYIDWRRKPVDHIS